MAGSDETFQAADVMGELNPACNKTSIETKERDEVQRERERGRKERMQGLKGGIIVPAVLVAVGGAAFSIFRKLREK